MGERSSMRPQFGTWPIQDPKPSTAQVLSLSPTQLPTGHDRQKTTMDPVESGPFQGTEYQWPAAKLRNTSLASARPIRPTYGRTQYSVLDDFSTVYLYGKLRKRHARCASETMLDYFRAVGACGFINKLPSPRFARDGISLIEGIRVLHEPCRC